MDQEILKVRMEGGVGALAFRLGESPAFSPAGRVDGSGRRRGERGGSNESSPSRLQIPLFALLFLHQTTSLSLPPHLSPELLLFGISINVVDFFTLSPTLTTELSRRSNGSLDNLCSSPLEEITPSR